MGANLMFKNVQYSAFSIVAIESIWPNDDGTEADLDILDLSYMSGLREVQNEFRTAGPIFEDSEISLGNKDEFVYAVVNFFFNPGGVSIIEQGFPNNYSSGYLENLLKTNSYDIIETLNKIFIDSRTKPGLSGIPYRFTWKLNFFNPQTKTANISNIIVPRRGPATTRVLSDTDSLAAAYVRHLINPTNLLTSENYENIKTFLTTYKQDKGLMYYDDTLGFGRGTALRPILISRAEQLRRIAENNEQINKSRNEDSRLGTNSNGLYPISIKRPDYNNLLKNSEDAYKKRRGYFKIIPLNITEVTTTFSPHDEEIGRNTFNLSFTMDDIIIVADKYAESQIKNIPTAIPISLNSGELNSVFRGIDLTKIQNSEEIATLGLSAYRISGANFPFNVEDLIESNDTVTIWLYHDPSEFDFVPAVGENTQKGMLDAFVFNKDFSYVIGNASRKSEDESNLIGREINATQRILNSSGVLNPYTSPLNRELLPDEENSYSSIQNLSPIDVLNIARSTGEFLALSPVNTGTTPIGKFSNSEFSQRARIGIDNVSNSFFPENQNLTKTQFSNLLETLYLSNSSNDFISSAQRASASTRIINSFEDILSLPEEQRVFVWNSKYGNRRLPGSTRTYSSLVPNPEDVFNALSDLSRPFTNISNNVLNTLRENNVANLVEPNIPSSSASGFFNKRKYLSTSSHGETPYLALKGHVNSISVSYGSLGAVNKVSISGSGYDKILKDNRVYYEDLFYPSTTVNFNISEVNSIYLDMLPPSAILHFISKHAPKFIMFGTSTQGHQDMLNTAINVIAQYPTLGQSEKRAIDERNEVAATGEVSGIFNKDLVLEPEEIEEDSDYDVVSFVRDLYKNKKVLSRGQVAIDANALNSSEKNNNKSVLFRFFYPVNYINTTRMQEMIRVILKAYYESPDSANIQSPITISTSSSISNNIAAMNGDPLINHIFIDETGRLRQRISFEAWERTPNPVYIPTITDREVVAGDSSFSRDGSQVLTMVDIRPYFGGTVFGDVRFAGRALSDGNDYIPVLLTSEGKSPLDNSNSVEEDVTSDLLKKNFFETISEPFFRYGKRYKNITRDIYARDENAAKRKALLLQRFFEKPVKEAKISVLGNTSYRAGETVLVNLQSYKHRSSELIDVRKMLNWLKYLKSDNKLLELYVGIDERFLNEDTYYLTNGILKNRQEFFWLRDYSKEFVLDKFIDAFEYLNGEIPGNGPKYITPEFFPTTMWAFKNQNTEIANKFNKNLTNSQLFDFYNTIYNSLINGETSGIGEFLSIYPEAINAIRFQNFKSTSYYIKSVSHNFIHGNTMTTKLDLTHGQDNLVILEPFTLRAIGFISIERRLKMGYDDVVVDSEGQNVYKNPNKQAKERILWEEFLIKKSPVQIMYEEQFYQDRKFKESSFLYSSQKNKNSSNFMYELALDLGIS
jgi:hypothetical protein